MNHTVSDRPIYQSAERVNIEPIFFNGDTVTMQTADRFYVDNQVSTSEEYWFRAGDLSISLKEIVELKQQVEELRAAVLKLKTGNINIETETVEL